MRDARRATMLIAVGSTAVLGALPTRAQAPATPPAAPIGPVDASRLTPGRWTYDQSVTVGGRRQAIGRRTVTLAAATYKGRAVWLLVDDTEASGARTADSLFAAKADLTPLHREMTATAGQRSARLVNDFGRDSVTGSMTAPDVTVPIALKNHPGLIANSAQLEMLLRLLPLRTGWRGRAEVFVPAGAGAGTVPIEITLTGEERLTTATGPVDSWTATIRGQAGEQRLWIDKARRRMLRMTSSTPMAPGALIELVLVSEAVAR